jgi:hypothetical protein
MTEQHMSEKTPGDIEAAVSRGVVRAAHELADDPQFTEKYWRTGFEHLTKHSSNSASQWIGKRILTAFVAAVVTAGILWLAKEGALK